MSGLDGGAGGLATGQTRGCSAQIVLSDFFHIETYGEVTYASVKVLLLFLATQSKT